MNSYRSHSLQQYLPLPKRKSCIWQYAFRKEEATPFVSCFEVDEHAPMNTVMNRAASVADLRRKTAIERSGERRGIK
jgi:hypothetical protein